MASNQTILPMLLSTLLLGAGGTVHADICADYAQRSVSQHEKNVFNLCGFRGSHWSSDYQRWNQECQSMSSKDIKHRLSMRDGFLDSCPVISYSGLGRNRQSKLLAALLRATEKKDIRLVETLIKSGVNLGVQPDWMKSSPLYIATQKNDLKLARILVANGAKPYLLAEGEENLLSVLLNRKHTNHVFLDFLLKSQANPNVAAKGREAEYPLVIAAAKGDFRAVNALLKYKADPNFYMEHSAIFLAVEQDHYPIARALIHNGANPNLGIDRKPCSGKLPLDIAFRMAKDRIIDLLLDNRALSSHECKPQ